jgi:hypothetical protein
MLYFGQSTSFEPLSAKQEKMLYFGQSTSFEPLTAKQVKNVVFWSVYFV